MYRWNLTVLLSSFSSRDCAQEFRQVLPTLLNSAKFRHNSRTSQHRKSPLARLPLAPWLLARHLVRAYSDNLQYLQYLQYCNMPYQLSDNITTPYFSDTFLR